MYAGGEIVHGCGRVAHGNWKDSPDAMVKVGLASPVVIQKLGSMESEVTIPVDRVLDDVSALVSHGRETLVDGAVTGSELEDVVIDDSWVMPVGSEVLDGLL